MWFANIFSHMQLVFFFTWAFAEKTFFNLMKSDVLICFMSYAFGVV